MTLQLFRITKLTFALFVFSHVSGCGSRQGVDLCEVVGTVMLDGKPLREASITFEPLEQGKRPSIGATDQNGNYKLLFAEGVSGAVPGKHLAKISTWQEGPDFKSSHPETVPAVYNSKAVNNQDMVKEVTGKRARIDFQLESKAGKIAQLPDPKLPKAKASTKVR